MTMFNSTKKWLDIPVVIKPFLIRDSADEKTFEDPVASFCYPEYKTTVLRNRHGQEVVSSTVLYMDSEDTLSEDDEIIFDGVEHVIKGLGKLYRKGKLNLWMVYI